MMELLIVLPCLGIETQEERKRKYAAMNKEWRMASV